MQDSQKREHYLRRADEVAAWISDREAVASSEELGKDLEHVEMLQKNFADFLKDLKANEASIGEVNKLAKKLLKERHPDTELIQGRLEAVNQSWADLRTLAKHREERLAGAHEIQKYNRYGILYIGVYKCIKGMCQCKAKGLLLKIVTHYGAGNFYYYY